MMFSTSKPVIVFYEKPGCAGNARQKKLLKQCGYELDVKHILNTPWTKDELERFFEGLDKEEIINNSAPDIKNNVIDPDKLSKDELIGYMLDNHILIKRPLMKFNDKYLCGFDTIKLSKILNVEIDSLQEISACTSDDVCKSV
jgi:nitrogenase-associated protein